MLLLILTIFLLLILKINQSSKKAEVEAEETRRKAKEDIKKETINKPLDTDGCYGCCIILLIGFVFIVGIVFLIASPPLTLTGAVVFLAFAVLISGNKQNN